VKKYIYILIVLFFAGAIGKSIYDELHKKTAKSTRLACHKDATVFERLVAPELLKQYQNSFSTGEVNVHIEIEKAHYMESKLFNYLDPQQLKDTFIDFAKLKDQSKQYPATMDILIYENDKNDPGKKNSKSKLYAGYLVFSAKYNKRLVYKVQIDFLDHQGKDTKKVLQCAIKSIQSLQ